MGRQLTPMPQILKRPAAGQDDATRKAFNPHPFFNPEVDEGCEPASVAYRCGCCLWSRLKESIETNPYVRVRACLQSTPS